MNILQLKIKEFLHDMFFRCIFAQNYTIMQTMNIDDSFFYKNEDTDKIYWIDTVGSVGEFLFSFDKKIVYNLFKDYPHELTKEQKAIFDAENPYWANFFSDRV